MGTYNVAVPVVALVEAASESEAITRLSEQLQASGFDVFEGELPDGAHAFESEDT